MKHVINIISAGSLLLTAHASSTQAAISPSFPIDVSVLATAAIRTDGQLVGAWRIKDRYGAHILVLTRKAGPSPAAPTSGRAEKLDLTATYYRQVQPEQWNLEWTIRDGSDCPGLDVEGAFYKRSVTFTDLNGDGRAEVSTAIEC